MTAVLASGIADRPRLTLIAGGRHATGVAATDRSPRLARSTVRPAALVAPVFVPPPFEAVRLLPAHPVPGPAARALAVAAVAGRFVVRRWAVLAGLLVAGIVILGGWMVVQAMGGVAGGGSLTPSGAPTSIAPPAGTAGGAIHPTVGQPWVVQPGDTLWGIVEAAGVHGDPRVAVAQLATQLDGAPLQPGDMVTVP